MPPLPVGKVLGNGLAGLRAGGGVLMIRSGVLMAVPAALLLVQLSTDSYWTNLVAWILALVLAGYAAWPLSRTALAAVSPGRRARPAKDDWWVRDGFVRASVVFYLTVAVGTVFFVVPGIMVMMIYSLYPFLIVERKVSGFQALARSSELTSGNRIRLLGVIFACVVLFVPGVLGLAAAGQGLAGVIAFWVLGIPALAFSFTSVAAAYRELASA